MATRRTASAKTSRSSAHAARKTTTRKSDATSAGGRARPRKRVSTQAKAVTLDSAGGTETEGHLGQVIANHVRARRLEIGLGVGQLAERTGISKGMLSKIENAQTSPSLSTLERLAGALDIPFTSLFRGLAEERDAVFVKAGSGPEIVRKGTRAGHTYELLGSLRGPYKRVEPLLVKLDEETEVFPLFQHSGIEILYMLSGVMEYGYGRQRYKMERGDTLLFEGDIPHGPTQLVKLPIRFLSITIFST
ncbi:MAG TPA: helix-turn-helix domain-containing protein [Acidimicrobiales bacterium]|nr:helix-turn-helix domain-containing protein [Acidimicrobiales bacterium]